MVERLQCSNPARSAGPSVNWREAAGGGGTCFVPLESLGAIMDLLTRSRRHEAAVTRSLIHYIPTLVITSTPTVWCAGPRTTAGPSPIDQASLARVNGGVCDMLVGGAVTNSSTAQAMNQSKSLYGPRAGLVSRRLPVSTRFVNKYRSQISITTGFHHPTARSDTTQLGQK